MAKEKEKESPPALIDYDTQIVNNVQPVSAFRLLKGYWMDLLRGLHQIQGVWNMKNQALLSKLLQEFSESTVQQMMDTWMHLPNNNAVGNFGAFYVQRYKINQQVIGSNYGDWDSA